MKVHPQEYQADLQAILGFVLKHDDSVNDRSEGSKLNSADETTRKLWLQEFSVPFARPGSMFRGKPPQGKLFPISSYFQRSLLALREIDVTVASVKITQLPKLQEDSLVLSVQLETDEKGQKMNKKKKQELYHNLHNVSGILIFDGIPRHLRVPFEGFYNVLYPFTFYRLYLDNIDILWSGEWREWRAA